MKPIGMRDIFWALMSGVLVTLPFLSFSLYPVAWIALVPLFSVLRGRTVGQGAGLGLAGGAVFGFAGIYWLKLVTGLGYALLAFYLAFYWAIWGAWVCFIGRRRPGWVWWAGAAGFTALEYLRTYLGTGFPWNLLGVSQALNLNVVQLAAWTGVYGLSFLIVLVNGGLAYAVFSRGKSCATGVNRFFRFVPAVVSLAVLASVMLLGRGELKKADDSRALPRLSLCLVQGGIAQGLKWDPRLAVDHLRTHVSLTRGAFHSRPKLVVWPESSLPDYLEEARELQETLGDLAREGRVYLMVGGDAREPVSAPDGRLRTAYYNSAYLIEPDGRIAGRYDKIHLVPFGEYVPLKRFLPFVKRVVPWEDDFSSGKNIVLFDLSGALPLPAPEFKMGVLICYEDIFPGLAREFVGRGARLLTNVTNDAWYGRTVAPYQHAYAALFRAVENRVYFGRSTNTGYSCVFDPWGRVVAEVADREGNALFVPGWCTAQIAPVPGRPFYSRHGDLFARLCVLLSFLAAVFPRPSVVKGLKR